MKIGSLFSGVGGLDAAVAGVFGADVHWYSEIDLAARRVLRQRYSHATNLGDIRGIDWSGVEPVDILTGGFPCQDLSLAGRRAGLRPDTRSGLWTHMLYAVEQMRPAYVVIENVKGILSARTAESESRKAADSTDRRRAMGYTHRALGRVVADLAGVGYDSRWVCLPATAVGAPHERERLFLVAARGEGAADAEGVRRERAVEAWGRWSGPQDCSFFSPEPRPAVHRPGIFGEFAEAVAHWEALTRPAPQPRFRAQRVIGYRTSAKFVEWMMGFPDGWATDVPGVTNTAALRLYGNAVCPQQAFAALTWLMERKEADEIATLV